MSSKSIKTFSAILVVLVLATISCEFSFDLGKKDSHTFRGRTAGYFRASGTGCSAYHSPN